MNKRPRTSENNGRAARLMKKGIFILSLFMLGVILFSITVFYIIPLEAVKEWAVARVRSETGLAVKEESLGRFFPFGVEAVSVRVMDAGGREAVYFDTLRARLAPLSLLYGKLRVLISGVVGTGVIDGIVVVEPHSASIRVMVTEVNFKDIPALKGRLEMEGAFGGDVSITVEEGGCPEGFVRMEGSGAKGASVMIMGVPLSLGNIDGAGIDAELAGCRARVKGLWIDGRDISMRLTGEVFLASPFSGSRIDMELEIIPGKRFLENEALLSVFSRYKRSANYYSVPVTGTLGSPRIGD